MKTDQYEPYRQEARKRWGRLSPYRLGRACADVPIEWTPPYDPGSRARRAYEQGQAYARGQQDARS